MLQNGPLLLSKSPRWLQDDKILIDSNQMLSSWSKGSKGWHRGYLITGMILLKKILSLRCKIQFHPWKEPSTKVLMIKRLSTYNTKHYWEQKAEGWVYKSKLTTSWQALKGPWIYMRQVSTYHEKRFLTFTTLRTNPHVLGIFQTQNGHVSFYSFLKIVAPRNHL